jgi:hypothetical protein
MAITTYAELKIAVANWLARDDATPRIPEFIALAEDRIALDERLRIRAMETSGDLTISAQTVALPTGFISARSLYIDGTPKKRIEFIAPEDFWIRNLAGQTGLPKWVTVEGENFVFGPAPDTTYTGKLLYWKRFTALSADTDTNWLLSNARGLLLYGALIEAADYLEDPRGDRWKASFEIEVTKVQKSNRRDRYSGAPLVARSDVFVY